MAPEKLKDQTNVKFLGNYIINDDKIINNNNDDDDDDVTCLYMYILIYLYVVLECLCGSWHLKKNHMKGGI